MAKYREDSWCLAKKHCIERLIVAKSQLYLALLACFGTSEAENRAIHANPASRPRQRDPNRAIHANPAKQLRQRDPYRSILEHFARN